jgi:threonine dehydratase
MGELSIATIRAAAACLEGKIVRTPLLHTPMLDEQAGCRVFVKAESLQLTGSFKLRGAMNKLLAMDPSSRRAGVVAFSAGNHGQAVAAAARAVDCDAVIVMPKTAPRIKVDNCRWWGAEVVLYDPHTEDRAEISRRIAEPRGMTIVPPFDDPDVMAGQGTCGLEIVEQLNEQGIRPSVVVIPCSGGGLASGAAEALRSAFSDVEIVIAEPLGYEKFARSLASGVPQSNGEVPKTVLDGIAGPTAGARPLAALLRHGPTGVGVSDDEALAAIAAAFKILKIVLEPAGAAALAAVLSGKVSVAGKNVVAIGSGGNVDPALFAKALARLDTAR